MSTRKPLIAIDAQPAGIIARAKQEVFPRLRGADAAEFEGLPFEATRDIRMRRHAVRAVLSARSHGRRVLRDVTRTMAAYIGVKVKRLQNMVSQWTADGGAGIGGAEGDWRGLWNTARWPREDVGRSLPRIFIEKEWHKLVRENAGGMSRAHDALVARWKAARRGDVTIAFAGYEEVPGPEVGSDLPRGWSYKNLTTDANRPSKYSVIAWQQGTVAGRSHGPMILTTRRELRAGQFLEFDDFRWDVQVSFKPSANALPQLCYPWQLAIMDVATAAVPSRFVKPFYKRADGTEDRFKDDHARLLMAAHFFMHGFDVQLGTLIHAEGGTAKIDDELAAMLREASGEKIRVGELSYGGALFQPYDRPSKSNPNRKAHIEAHHKLLKGMAGALKGYTGGDYSEKPDMLDHWKKEQLSLIKAAMTLPPDRRAMLAINAITFETFEREIHPALYGAYHESRVHELEGWSGRMCDAVRMMGGMGLMLPAAIAALGDGEREALRLALAQGQAVAERVRMTRGEAWLAEWREGRATGRLECLSGRAACEIVVSTVRGDGEDPCRVVRTRRLRKAYFVIQETRLAALDEEQFYEARVQDDRGEQRELSDGEYVLIFNPFAPQWVFVCDEKRRFIGVAPRVERIDPTDREALLEAWGHRNSRESERNAQSGLAEAAREARKIVDAQREHNKKVFRKEPISEAEKARAAELQEQVAAVTPEDIAAVIEPGAEIEDAPEVDELGDYK